MHLIDRLARRVRAQRLAREERGVMTVWNLFFTLTACTVGAVALDTTYFYAERSQLQVSADLAAHAALYTRSWGDVRGGIRYPMTEAASEAATIAAVEFGMPPSFFGRTIDAPQIVYGNWDVTTDRFVPAPNPPTQFPDAVAVVTDRAGANRAETFLFGLAGLSSVNIATGALFTLGPGDCDDEQGYFSQSLIEINSGNTFQPGICIAAPTIGIQNNNAFRLGVGVTVRSRTGLPHRSNLFDNNPGLEEAVQYGPTDVSEHLNRIAATATGLPAGREKFAQHNYAYWMIQNHPAYRNILNSPMVVTETDTGSPNRSFTPAQLASGRAHWIQCASPSRSISLRDSGANQTFRNMVILTNCNVDFGSRTILENVIVSTTNDRVSSIQAPRGLSIGLNDNCAPSGGAALITRGGVRVAADVGFYGAMIRATGEVSFTSGGNGQGLSVIAGGRIDTQSGGNMAPCGVAAGTRSTNVSLVMRR